MAVKIFVLFILLIIIGSLGSAMFYLMKDHGDSKRVVKALSIRVGLSMFAFFVLMGAYYFGFIEANTPFPS